MIISIELKKNYFVIVGIALITLLIGGYYTLIGMSWYQTIILPSIVPQNWVFRLVWHIIFALTTIAAVYVWNQFKDKSNFITIMVLFCMNAFLNGYWSYLFFYHHSIGAAFVDAVFLQINTLALFILIFRNSWMISLLLLPYIAWNFFAIALNLMIWQLN